MIAFPATPDDGDLYSESSRTWRYDTALNAWEEVRITLADSLSYDPTASGLAATDVQAAIDELAAEGGGAHVSADITDAATIATPDTLVKRGADGEAEFGLNAVTAYTGPTLKVGFGDGAGLLLEGGAGSGNCIEGKANGSTSWTIAVDGQFAWYRQNVAHDTTFTGILTSTATLEDTRTWTLPDASGTVLLRQEICTGAIINPYVGNLDFSGGLGAWDGDIADIDLDGGTDIGADLADADLILVDYGAGGTNRKSAISRVWTYIKAKIDAGQTWAGVHAFSSTTRPTSSGTGTPAPTSLVTLTDVGIRTLQIVNVEQTADFSTAAIIPIDASIPQNTEGAEYITATITPTISTSTLEIVAELSVGASAGAQFIAALFQDSVADAMQVVGTSVGNTLIYHLRLRHVVASGSTTARTYKIRVGSNGVTAYVNRASGSANTFGSALISRLSIREIL